MTTTSSVPTVPASVGTTDDLTRAELHAIQVSTEALAALTEDEGARARVVRYLIDRFHLTSGSVCPRCRK